MPTQRSWTAGVVREVLPNGLTLLVQREPSAPAVAVVTHVKAGFFDEPDRWGGISHVLEHMFFKGTPTRGVGEVARQTKAAGGYLNAGTAYDYTTYYVTLPADQLETALDIQADALQHASLDREELARELQVIIQEAKRKLDSPGALAHETLHEVLFDRHRIRRWRIGTESALAGFTREDVAGYYESRYVPDRTIVAIVGDVDPAEALRAARARYADWPARPAATDRSPEEPPRRDVRARTLRGPIALAELALGWRTVPPLHPDAAALDLAAAVLGSGRGSWLYRGVRATGPRHQRLRASLRADGGRRVQRRRGTRARQAAGRARGNREGGARPAHRGTRACRHRACPGAPPDPLGPAARDDGRPRERARVRRGAPGRGVARRGIRAARRGHGRRRAARGASGTSFRTPSARWRTSRTGAAPTSTPRRSRRHSAGWRRRADLPAAEPAPVIRAVNGRPAGQRRAGVLHVALDGVDLLVRRKTGVPAVSLGVYASRAGLELPTEAGLGSLALRSAIRGAGQYDAEQLALAFERLGGSLGASTATDWLGMGTTVMSERLAPAAALLRLAMDEPRFVEDGGDARAGPHDGRGAAGAGRHLPLPVSAGLPLRVRRHLLRSPGRRARGDAGRRSPPTRVAAWHREAVRGHRLTVVAVGDLDPDRAADQLAAVFRDWRSAPRDAATAVEWTPGAAPVMRVAELGKAQSAFAMLFPGPGRRDPLHHAAEVWAAVASGLGGRLFDALREQRSLAYTVLAFAWPRLRAGALGTYIATSPEREEEAREAMLAELARFANEPVTPDELRGAVGYLAGQAEVQRQSAGHVLSEIVEAWLIGRGLEELEDPAAPYRRVTAEEVWRVARASLRPERRAEGVVRGTGGGR